MKGRNNLIDKKNIIQIECHKKRQSGLFGKQGISLLIILTIIGCTNKTFITEQELWNYLKNEENGYILHKNINGYDFKLLYKPTDLLVKQELDHDSSKEKINELREKYSQFMYFNLSMSKSNKELLSTAPKSRNEFGAMVNELAFGMGDKVHLYSQQKDTIELLDFIYPRMYGMSQSTDILFVYPRDKKYLKNEYLNFIVEDLGMYTGEVKFKVLTKKINNEPKIKF